MKISLKIELLLFLSLFYLLYSPLNAYSEENKYDAISKKYGFTLQEEVEVGFQAGLTLIGRYGIYKNPPINQYVSSIGQNIVKKVSKRPDIIYRFIILNTDEVNAFATPGGFIFITKGTLKIMDDEAELVATLSHEITHVEEGDGLAAIASNPDAKEKLRITASLTSSEKSLSKQYLDDLDKELKNAGNDSKNIVNFEIKNEVDSIFNSKTTN